MEKIKNLLNLFGYEKEFYNEISFFILSDMVYSLFTWLWYLRVAIYKVTILATVTFFLKELKIINKQFWKITLYYYEIRFHS